MPTYTETPAEDVQPGDLVRKLATVGPSVADPDGGGHPWTVARVQQLGKGRVRIWAHPHGARVSITSPANYGNFAELDTVEVYQ